MGDYHFEGAAEFGDSDFPTEFSSDWVDTPQDLVMGLYEHFKGDLYLLHCVAQHSEDQSQFVVYQNVRTGRWWLRPRAMWDERVIRDGYNGPRFKLIRAIE